VIFYIIHKTINQKEFSFSLGFYRYFREIPKNKIEKHQPLNSPHLAGGGPNMVIVSPTLTLRHEGGRGLLGEFYLYFWETLKSLYKTKIVSIKKLFQIFYANKLSF